VYQQYIFFFFYMTARGGERGTRIELMNSIL
jgi:hypothetical protein